MVNKHALVLLSLLFSMACYSQSNQIIIAKYIKLPADSVQSKQLITSLNGFINQLDKPYRENTFILKENLPETAMLSDEIKGMADGNGADKKGIYKCYLNNVIQLDSANHLVQFSYIAITDETPSLRASFELIAQKTGDQFLFSSPLKLNTQTWKSKETGSFVFHYATSLVTAPVYLYSKKAAEFDKKLNAPKYTTQFYLCDNLHEALQLLGVTYKADYNGIAHDNFATFENNESLMVFGTNEKDREALDIHDCWHNRLHHAVPTTNINRPIDEACAYIYGGSWGYSWPYIFTKFKMFMGTDHDWLKAFNENKNFGDNQQYHLYVQYVISALVIQQLEKEKGFSAVIELLTCGKRQPDNENYFKALEKVAGINKANFNERIEKLVEKESGK